MTRRQTFTDCVRNAEHYLAIGQTDIYLDSNDDDLPWHLAVDCGAGGSYRLNGPSSARVTAAHESGLSFRWHFDFEGREANGTGVNQFDSASMLANAAKMPVAVREKFSAFLTKEVWPEVRKRTDEVRDALRKQEESLQVLQSIMVSVGGAAA